MSIYQGYHKPSPWKYQVFDRNNVRFTNIPLYENKPLERNLSSVAGNEAMDENHPEAASSENNDHGEGTEQEKPAMAENESVGVPNADKTTESSNVESTDTTSAEPGPDADVKPDEVSPSNDASEAPDSANAPATDTIETDIPPAAPEPPSADSANAIIEPEGLTEKTKDLDDAKGASEQLNNDLDSNDAANVVNDTEQELSPSTESQSKQESDNPTEELVSSEVSGDATTVSAPATTDHTLSKKKKSKKAGKSVASQSNTPPKAALPSKSSTSKALLHKPKANLKTKGKKSKKESKSEAKNESPSAAQTDSKPPADETTADGPPATTIAADDTAVKDIAADGVIANDIASDYNTAEDTAVEEAVVENAAADDAAGKDTAADDTAAKIIVVDEVAANKAAIDDSAANDTTVDEAVLEQNSANDAAASESPEIDALAQATPADETSVGDVPIAEAPIGKTQETPATNTEDRTEESINVENKPNDQKLASAMEEETKTESEKQEVNSTTVNQPTNDLESAPTAGDNVDSSPKTATDDDAAQAASSCAHQTSKDDELPSDLGTTAKSKPDGTTADASQSKEQQAETGAVDDQDTQISEIADASTMPIQHDRGPIVDAGSKEQEASLEILSGTPSNEMDPSVTNLVPGSADDTEALPASEPDKAVDPVSVGSNENPESALVEGITANEITTESSGKSSTEAVTKSTDSTASMSAPQAEDSSDAKPSDHAGSELPGETRAVEAEPSILAEVVLSPEVEPTTSAEDDPPPNELALNPSVQVEGTAEQTPQTGTDAPQTPESGETTVAATLTDAALGENKISSSEAPPVDGAFLAKSSSLECSPAENPDLPTEDSTPQEVVGNGTGMETSQPPAEPETSDGAVDQFAIKDSVAPQFSTEIDPNTALELKSVAPGVAGQHLATERNEHAVISGNNETEHVQTEECTQPPGANSSEPTDTDHALGKRPGPTTTEDHEQPPTSTQDDPLAAPGDTNRELPEVDSLPRENDTTVDKTPSVDGIVCSEAILEDSVPASPTSEKRRRRHQRSGGWERDRRDSKSSSGKSGNMISANPSTDGDLKRRRRRSSGHHRNVDSIKIPSKKVVGPAQGEPRSPKSDRSKAAPSVENERSRQPSSRRLSSGAFGSLFSRPRLFDINRTESGSKVKTSSGPSEASERSRAPKLRTATSDGSRHQQQHHHDATAREDEEKARRVRREGRHIPKEKGNSAASSWGGVNQPAASAERGTRRNKDDTRRAVRVEARKREKIRDREESEEAAQVKAARRDRRRQDATVAGGERENSRRAYHQGRSYDEKRDVEDGRKEDGPRSPKVSDERSRRSDRKHKEKNVSAVPTAGEQNMVGKALGGLKRILIR